MCGSASRRSRSGRGAARRVSPPLRVSRTWARGSSPPTDASSSAPPRRGAVGRFSSTARSHDVSMHRGWPGSSALRSTRPASSIWRAQQAAPSIRLSSIGLAFTASRRRSACGSVLGRSQRARRFEPPSCVLDVRSIAWTRGGASGSARHAGGPRFHGDVAASRLRGLAEHDRAGRPSFPEAGRIDLPSSERASVGFPRDDAQVAASRSLRGREAERAPAASTSGRAPCEKRRQSSSGTTNAPSSSRCTGPGQRRRKRVFRGGAVPGGSVPIRTSRGSPRRAGRLDGAQTGRWFHRRVPAPSTSGNGTGGHIAKRILQNVCQIGSAAGLGLREPRFFLASNPTRPDQRSGVYREQGR